MGTGFSLSKKSVFSLFFLLSVVLQAMVMRIPARATVGITDGPINALAVSPENPGTVYAGTGSGIYKSVNYQDIWSPVNEGLTSLYVYSLIIPADAPDMLYAATRDGIFKSTDQGEEWEAGGLQGSQVYSLAIHAVTPTYLAAGTPEGVFTTTDGGASWSEQAAGPAYVYAIAANPAKPDIFYAGSFGQGVYKSIDFGKTWSKTGSGPDNVNDIAINPSRTATVYAATDDGLYESNDSGADWDSVSAGFTGVPVYSIAVQPSDPSVIYTATDRGLFKSTDAANSWTRINSGIITTGTQGPFARRITIDPTANSTVYAGTFSGENYDADIYKSTDGGTSWTQINRELSNTIVYCLAFDAADTALAYAGTSTLGVLKSTNGGLSWQEANSGLTSFLVRAVAVNPDTSDVYAGTASGLFISSDAGETWTEKSPNHEVYHIGVDPFAPENIYIGTNNGIFLSTDDGTAWSSLNTNLTNPYIYSIVFDPLETGLLYVGTNGDGIFKTTSGGESWSPVNTGLNAQHLGILSLAVDPAAPSGLYAGTRGGGMYQTSNGGETWDLSGEALAGISVQSMAINPEDPDILYAGTRQKGFYRSTSAGRDWVQTFDGCDEDLFDETVYDLKLHPENPQTLYVALEKDIKICLFNSPPGRPEAPSPADAAANQQITVTLQWSCTDQDAGDSLTYEVFFGTDQEPDNGSSVTVSAPEYDPGMLEFGQTYYWQIVAVDGNLAKTPGPVWSFSTAVSRPPLVPSNPVPRDASENQPITTGLSWTGGDPDAEDTVSYDLYLGTRENPRLVRENLEETAYQPSQLLAPLTTYYWKIVARDNNMLETSGPVWSFTTALLPDEDCLAEAALGKGNPDLHTRRSFRDTVLLATPSGRNFVRSYYLLSPALTGLVRQHPEAMVIAQKGIKAALPIMERALRTGKIFSTESLSMQVRSLCNMFAAQIRNR